MKTTTRITVESVTRLAHDKGFDFFASRRRGSRYTARPNSDSIFRRDPGPWGFFDLRQAEHFFLGHEGAIATRVDYALMRSLRAMRTRRAAQPLAA